MFRPVDEQFAVLTRGAAQLETADELKRKLKKSLDKIGRASWRERV